MIITNVEPIMLCYKPKNAPRDGLANIPARDVFLVKVHTDENFLWRKPLRLLLWGRTLP